MTTTGEKQTKYNKAKFNQNDKFEKSNTRTKPTRICIDEQHSNIFKISRASRRKINARTHKMHIEQLINQKGT